MSEIQALTDRVRDLNNAIDFWNTFMLWGLALAALAALVIGFSTRLVVVRSAQLSNVQGNLNTAKDRQLQADLKAKSETATEGIATAQKKAALANRIAESERLERVKLQERVSWRTVSPETIAAIGSRLKTYRGVRIGIGTLADNDEAVAFSEDIAAIVRAADWPFSGITPYGNLGVQRFGMRISTTRDEPMKSAARDLSKELAALGFNPALEESDKVFDNGMPGIYVMIELKPRIVPTVPIKQ